MTASQQSTFSNEEYTVGWICSLDTELAAAKGMMDEIHGNPQTVPDEADNNTYILGSMGEFKVAVACLPLHQPGSSSAAVSAKEMLFTFPNIRIGLLVGIGAGIPDPENGLDIRLGDVVVGSDPATGGVVVYDFGKKLADGSFQSLSILNRPPRSLSSALVDLRAKHMMEESKIACYLDKMIKRYPRMRKHGYCHPGKSTDRLFQPNYLHHEGKKTCIECETSHEVLRDERLDDEPVIHYGTIASGSMVVKDASTRVEIQKKHSAICLEMEAAGLMNNFPCVVIRGISDYADSHKNDRWKPFAAAVAAAYAREFLDHVQPRAVDGEPALKDVLYQVHDNVKSITKFAEIQQNQHILDWISPTDFVAQQTDIIAKRQEGTGIWFLQSDEFSKWLNCPRQTLFCPGIPGAGKSMMSSIVVDHLKTKFRDSDVQVGCIFCSHQPSHPQTNLALQLSLLRQLAVKDFQVLASVDDLYSRHSKDRTRPTITEIQAQLLEAAKSYTTVFIVIDALDEYHSLNPEEMQEFLTGIFNLQKDAPVNLFVTSRFNSGTLARFEGCDRKEIRANENDILKYVERRLPRLLFSEISKYPAVEEEVRRGIVKSADGMFLLAMLNMDYLMGYPTIGELELALTNLPHGEARLRTAYDKAIERIESQHEPCYKLAVKTLSWLAYSKRVLFAKELQHALGTHDGMKDLDQKFMPALDIIDTLCAGLVVFDRESDIIRLVHYTTREFLVGSHICRNAETEIAKISITYLSLSAFSSGRSTRPEEYVRRQEIYPLHQYCARNWAQHASAALDDSKDLMPFVLAFLDKESNLYAASQAAMAPSNLHHDPKYLLLVDHIPRRLTKIHLAAQAGLKSVIAEYIRQGQDLEVRDSEGRTPLAFAAGRGHLETVRAFLESKRVDIDSRDNNNRTPLFLAASGGHKEVVGLLIHCGAFPDPEDHFGKTALCTAASSGSIDTMRILLDYGAQINPQPAFHSKDNSHPLMEAWCSGIRDAVLFLLERGANPNLPDGMGYTILTMAARYNDEELVKCLLKRGVFVDPRCSSGHTPLHWAAEGGFAGITMLLLGAGADFNTQNDRNESVLISACQYGYNEEGHEETVYQLLCHGANPNTRDDLLETALLISIERGSVGVVKLLLANGADPNITNRRGETALFYAAKKGYTELIEGLLERKADLSVCNEALENALFPSVKEGHVLVANRLLDAGLDVDCQDIARNTPLFFAASSGSEEVIRLLLERGADIHHRNALRETALFFAARNGQSTVVKLLIEAGAAKDPRNLLMETPLIHAASGLRGNRSRHIRGAEYSSAVSYFLDHDVDPDPSNDLVYQSKEDFEAWETLFSCSIYKSQARELQRKPDLRVSCCEAARHIWRSDFQEYNNNQLLILLNRLIFENDSTFRKLWRKGKATPLLWAVGGGHTELTARLLNIEGGRVTCNKTRAALLEASVASRNPFVAELLLNELIDASVPNSHLSLMIQQAAAQGDIAMMSTLFLRQQTSSEVANKALLKAISGGHTECVRFLLEKGAEPLGTSTSETPLHTAVFRGDLAVIELLLQQRIDLDKKDKHGRTPLFYAVQGGQLAIAQLLLQHGADPDFADEKGQGPLHMLVDRSCDSKSIVRLLLKAGSDPNQKNKYGRTPLMGAVVCMLRDMAATLLECPTIDRNAADLFGRTALVEATRRKRDDMLKLLGQDCRESQSAFPNNITEQPIEGSSRRCDICQGFLAREEAYTCFMCNGGDFDICGECKEWGATCLESTHPLSIRSCSRQIRKW